MLHKPGQHNCTRWQPMCSTTLQSTRHRTVKKSSLGRTNAHLRAYLHKELGMLLAQISTQQACMQTWTMFGSSWCHHCHELFPSVYAISKKYPQHKYVVAQMDYMKDAVQGIKYTPTFRLYKNGRRIDEFVGTDAQRVEDHVWLWSEGSGGSCTIQDSKKQ